MNTDEILKLKKLLDEGAITQAEFDKEKQKLMNDKSMKKNNLGLVVGIVLVFLLCISIISGSVESNTQKEPPMKMEEKDIESLPEEFKDEFPISISGKMYDNILGFPELSLHITNTTEKDVSAVKFYFAPKDVYGDDNTNIFSMNQLYTDDTILANESVTKTWQMLDSSVKSGDVYVYSVYFADGTEWGDKEATVSDIKKYGHKLQVKY